MRRFTEATPDKGVPALFCGMVASIAGMLAVTLCYQTFAGGDAAFWGGMAALALGLVLLAGGAGAAVRREEVPPLFVWRGLMGMAAFLSLAGAVGFVDAFARAADAGTAVLSGGFCVAFWLTLDGAAIMLVATVAMGAAGRLGHGSTNKKEGDMGGLREETVESPARPAGGKKDEVVDAGRNPDRGTTPAVERPAGIGLADLGDTVVGSGGPDEGDPSPGVDMPTRPGRQKVRMHESGGEYHFHDDAGQLKVAVQVAHWQAQLRPLQYAAGVRHFPDYGRGTVLVVETEYEDNKGDGLILQTWLEIKPLMVAPTTAAVLRMTGWIK